MHENSPGGPGGPVAPGKPSAPGGPVAPAGPGIPCGPGCPGSPAGPGGPVAPCGPVATSIVTVFVGGSCAVPLIATAASTPATAMQAVEETPSSVDPLIGYHPQEISIRLPRAFPSPAPICRKFHPVLYECCSGVPRTRHLFPFVRAGLLPIPPSCLRLHRPAPPAEQAGRRRDRPRTHFQPDQSAL
jgi:hypothetical protein